MCPESLGRTHYRVLDIPQTRLTYERTACMMSQPGCRWRINRAPRPAVLLRVRGYPLWYCGRGYAPLGLILMRVHCSPVEATSRTHTLRFIVTKSLVPDFLFYRLNPVFLEVRTAALMACEAIAVRFAFVLAGIGVELSD